MNESEREEEQKRLYLSYESYFEDKELLNNRKKLPKFVKDGKEGYNIIRPGRRKKMH